MAQLDSLIDALFKHSAEALLLDGGDRPALLLDGVRRPIVKAPLAADRVLALVVEIAPGESRSAVETGGSVAFPYRSGERSVRVEVAPGPSVRIRADQPAPAAQAAKPAAQAAKSAPSAPALRGPLTMDGLFRTLFERGGSDLHLSSARPPMIRLDGDLEPLEGLSVLDPATVERLVLSIAPAHKREEFERRGDTDFAYELTGVCRIRCNLFRDRLGSGGVFRVIPSKILTTEDLKLPRVATELCHLTKGLVLVTGPTGSGKSTTLAALVDYINRTRRDHIITIEDPIEFVHETQSCLVNQREISVHTEGFKTALRAALREDPDVVLVGEMRDLETVAIALETAETGHLVFGTLHTTSAVSTIDRLIDQFPADQQEQVRMMLSDALKAVMAQVLCKRIGGGRVAALEILIVNAAVSNLIREGKSFQIPSLMQTGKKLGMTLFNDSLLELVRTKQVTPQEAWLRALDKTNLISAFRNQRIPVDFLEPEGAA